MFTIRQLINSAYKLSSVCAIGQTPSASEVEEALELLNGVLDNFGMESLFRPGIITRTVTSKTDGSIVIANDASRVISSGIGNGVSYALTTNGPHNLNVGDSIVIAGNGVVDGTNTVNNITSINAFTIASTALNSSYAGTFKLATQSDANLIDLAIDYPDSIQSVTDGVLVLTELPADIFYRDRYLGSNTLSWYYETSLDPYPTLYLDTRRTVQINFVQPGYRNVSLDVDTDKWPSGMKEAVKWRVSADIAMINGYTDISTQCINRFNDIIAKIRTANRKSFGLIADASAPGYAGGYYDIATDTFV